MTGHPAATLIIMRHAKASFAAVESDHERPLASAGHDQAARAGKWLSDSGYVPDCILCSTALRTRQTCAWVCKELGEKAPTPKLEDDLYDGGASKLVTLVNHAPQTVTSLLVISHLPTVQDAALRLASRESEQEAYLNLAAHFPTSGTAVIAVEKPWAELDHQDARLVDFWSPR